MVYHAQVDFHDLQKNIEEIVNSLNPESFKKARWFRQKSAQIQKIDLLDFGSILSSKGEQIILPSIVILNMLEPLSGKKSKEPYYLPLLISKYKLKDQNHWLEIQHKNYRAYVYDGIHSLAYNRFLERIIRGDKEVKLNNGGILRGKLLAEGKVNSASLLTDVSSNSLTLLKKNEIVKTYRRLIEGINPDLEIGEHLYQETNFRNFPKIQGYVNYLQADGTEYSLCVLEEFINNRGDAWAFTRNYLKTYLKFASIGYNREELKKHIEKFACKMYRLGEVIGDLHIALAEIERESFHPGIVHEEQLKRWYEKTNKNLEVLYQHLQDKKEQLPDNLKSILKMENDLKAGIKKIFSVKDFIGKNIRVHGDLHLEQILLTEDDFLVLDFEGEPMKDIAERRTKQPPLKDLAGMLRSFNYAGYAALFAFQEEEGSKALELREAIRLWEGMVTDYFLKGYLQNVREKRPDLLPPATHFSKVLALFKLEKAFYEGIYEINNRPDWVRIPLEGILNCLEELQED